MSSHRLFFAIGLPESIQNLLSEYLPRLEQLIGVKNVRWTKAENLHVTLQFMGSVETGRINQLVDAVAREVEQIPSFKLELGAPKLFPSISQPRFISLNAGPHNHLSQLSNAIGHSLSALGYPLEQRPYRGHVTLGRIQHVDSVDALKNQSFSKIPGIEVTQFYLFESKLNQGKSNYLQLAQFNLDHSDDH